MAEFLLKLLISAMLTAVIKVGVAVSGHWIAWWLAALIAVVVTFGGWLIVDLDDVDGAWH